MINRLTGMPWPERWGEYSLERATDSTAFYQVQIGGFAFYQGLDVRILHAKADPKLTMIQVFRLTGNMICRDIVNWTEVATTYFATTTLMFAGKPMTQRQVDGWVKKATKRHVETNTAFANRV